MLEKYSDKSRRILFFARNKAAQYSNPFIDTVHILHGIIMEEDSYMSRLFRQLKLDTIKLRKAIDTICIKLGRAAHSGDIPMTDSSSKLLQLAVREAFTLGEERVEIYHIFLAILSQPASTAVTALREGGLSSLIEARNHIINNIMLEEDLEDSEDNYEQKLPLLSKFGRDITKMAKADKFDKCVGREIEIERIVHILSRRRKNNPLLLGEAGVGKTAIVEGLATKIVKNDVPKPLHDKVIFAVDIYNIVAGTKYRGQFEERLRDLLAEASNNGIILFIDEFHSIVGAGSAEGSLDAANILKPALARSEVQIIGATTYKDFSKTIEKDKSLMRRFQPVKVVQPTQEETLEILKGIKDRYEEFHGVSYSYESLKVAVNLSERYITNRMQPDKAIDLIDEAGARVKLLHCDVEVKQGEEKDSRLDSLKEIDNFFPELDILKESKSNKEESDKGYRPVVTAHNIEEAVSSWTGIPVTSITESERERLLNLKDYLVSRVVGQNHAVETLVKAIKRSRLGLSNPYRPAGVFMFLGPTGVGKTELSKQLAVYLFKSEKNLIRIDMTEYMEKHSVSRLIGSPPGYVGYEEGGQLTEIVKKKPYSVILFDEIEKAHGDLINILLQIFDEGRITDAFGETINFKNTIIIMTSNTGSRVINDKSSMGFHIEDSYLSKNKKDLVMKEVKKYFAPEFLNRIDDIVVFNSLGKEELMEIVYILVNDLNNLLIEKGLKVSLTEKAMEYIVDMSCKELNYGARPIKRAIQVYIQDRISDLLINSAEEVKGEYLFDVEKGKLHMNKVKEYLEVKC
jgi:ATP-dependent Clp protease ATP-binding subunit ClpC